MRSHISEHGATAKYFSNSFVLKTEIEKEGLPRDITPDLGAGVPEFESRRPDHFISFIYRHLAMQALGVISPVDFSQAFNPPVLYAIIQ